MTCIVDVNGDYLHLRDDLKLRTCSLDISEDAHQGRYNESNYPVQELRWKRRGGLIFERGVLAGHYGISSHINKPTHTPPHHHTSSHPTTYLHTVTSPHPSTHHHITHITIPTHIPLCISEHPHLFFWHTNTCLPSAPIKFSSSIISIAVRNTGLSEVSREL